MLKLFTLHRILVLPGLTAGGDEKGIRCSQEGKSGTVPATVSFVPQGDACCHFIATVRLCGWEGRRKGRKSGDLPVSNLSLTFGKKCSGMSSHTPVLNLFHEIISFSAGCCLLIGVLSLCTGSHQ